MWVSHTVGADRFLDFEVENLVGVAKIYLVEDAEEGKIEIWSAYEVKTHSHRCWV